MLIACNHPNSFLDAIILATLFKKPVYSLARGDVFKKPFYAKFMLSMNMLPVYRASEGVENLENNYTTFEKCKDIFKQGGIVLIFSEGRCINEWHLRKLMKGTARLAMSSWQDGIPLQVLPTGINYSSFKRFGKNVQLNFGECITKAVTDPNQGEGRNIIAFNRELSDQLGQLVVELDPADKEGIQQQFSVSVPLWKKVLLLLPALIGAVIHFPLYYPVKKFVWSKTAHNDHFDSVMVAIFFILYPLAVLLATIACLLITKQTVSLLALFALPFTAWTCIQLKPQF